MKKLREHIQFNMKVGSNGKVWISARMADTVFIFNAFERCVQTMGDRVEIERMLTLLQ